jgi:hypothetical protein
MSQIVTHNIFIYAQVRKLRASIADLSEESARDLVEVERRGLSGGINLVRGLREELRDVEFQLSEANSMNAACQAKIQMIQSRMQQTAQKKTNAAVQLENNGQPRVSNDGNNSAESEEPTPKRIVTKALSETSDSETSFKEIDIMENGTMDEQRVAEAEVEANPVRDIPVQPVANKSQPSKEPKQVPRGSAAIVEEKPASERIATGDSEAIVPRYGH